MVILNIFASVLITFMKKRIFRGPYSAIFTDIQTKFVRVNRGGVYYCRDDSLGKEKRRE